MLTFVVLLPLTMQQSSAELKIPPCGQLSVPQTRSPLQSESSSQSPSPSLHWPLQQAFFASLSALTSIFPAPMQQSTLNDNDNKKSLESYAIAAISRPRE